MVPSDGLRKDDSLLLQVDHPHMTTLFVDILVQHRPECKPDQPRHQTPPRMTLTLIDQPYTVHYSVCNHC